MLRIVCACVALTCAATSRSAGQGVGDPLSGKWELNVSRTHYGGGAEVRQNEVFTCTRNRIGVDCTIKSLRADGKEVVGGFSASYDGTPGVTRGMPEMDHVRLTKVSESIADATFTFKGRAVFAYRAVRSAGGRSLTIVSVDPVTRAVLNSVVVYDQR